MLINIFVVLLLIAILIFVVLEIKKMKMIKKSAHSIGNGQYIGEMEYQNDYFTIIKPSECECLLTVADGVSLRRNIRASAVMANNVIKEIYLKNRNLHSLKDLLDYAFEEISNRNRRIMFENRIALSILSVQVRDDLLSYGQVGTCALLLFRDNIITNIITSETSEQSYGNFKIKTKDKIILLTKGAFMSLTEMEIIDELNTSKETNDKAISLINTIRNKRYKHQENATVIILEVEQIFS